MCVGGWGQDTFDHAPNSLDLEDRVRYTISHAGPSIVIASLTDILAFLTAAFTPIPVITYFCVTVAFCLIIALVLVNTWYLAWIYRIEKKRMAKAEATEGQEKYAGPNGGAEIEASPMSVWCSEKYAKTLMKTPVKVLVVAISLALFATSPIGISKLTPEYGPEVRCNGHIDKGIVDSTCQRTAPLNIASQACHVQHVC